MSTLTDDSDMIDNAVESSAGKQCDLTIIIVLTMLSTVDDDSDQGSSDIQWFAVHFLVVWYRDVMCLNEERGSTKCVIREAIITKLTTEVGKLLLSVYVHACMIVCVHVCIH